MKELIFVQKYVQNHKFQVKNDRIWKYADTLVDSPMYVTQHLGSLVTLRGLLRLWMLLDRVITELLGLDRELERELDLAQCRPQ